MGPGRETSIQLEFGKIRAFEFRGRPVKVRQFLEIELQAVQRSHINITAPVKDQLPPDRKGLTTYAERDADVAWQ